MPDLKKILVLRFSSLGDIVMSTPMVRCLRTKYPLAQIDMVVRSDFMDLIENNPHITNKIGLDKTSGAEGLKELKKRINKEGYDLIYDAHRSLRTLILMPFLKAPHKAYFKKYYIQRALSLLLKVNFMKDKKRFLERYAEPLAPYGVFYDGKGPELFLSEEKSRSAFQKAGLNSQISKWVGLIPSAQWPGKRWPASRFRDVCEKIVRETSMGVCIFGGKSDTFCSEIAKGFDPSRVVNTQGSLSIAESAAVLNKCEFVVANDTGLMHVADALNIPSVLVLGPTSEAMGCLPFHPQTKVVEKHLWCRPCSKNGQAPCIRGHRICLESISRDDVFSAVLRLRQELPV